MIKKYSTLSTLFDEIFMPSFSLVYTNTFDKLTKDYHYEESENDITFEFSLPGYKKEDIEVSIIDNKLKVSSKVKDEKSKWRKEFKYEYYISQNTVNQEGVSAKFEDGILKVIIPKKEKTKTKIEIQ